MADSHQRFFSNNGGPPMGGVPTLPPSSSASAGTRTHYVVPQHPRNRNKPQPPNGGVPPGAVWPLPPPAGSWGYLMPQPMPPAFLPSALPCVTQVCPKKKEEKEKEEEDDEDDEDDDKQKVQTRYVVPQHPRNRKKPLPPNGGLPPGASIVSPTPSWLTGSSHWFSLPSLTGLPSFLPINPFAWMQRQSGGGDDGDKKDQVNKQLSAYFLGVPTATYGPPGVVVTAGGPMSPPVVHNYHPPAYLSWGTPFGFMKKEDKEKADKKKEEVKQKPKKPIYFRLLPPGLHPEYPWPTASGQDVFGMDFTTFDYADMITDKPFTLDSTAREVLTTMGGMAYIKGATIVTQTEPWRWRAELRLPPYCGMTLAELGLEWRDSPYYLADRQ